MSWKTSDHYRWHFFEKVLATTFWSELARSRCYILRWQRDHSLSDSRFPQSYVLTVRLCFLLCLQGWGQKFRCQRIFWVDGVIRQATSIGYNHQPRDFDTSSDVCSEILLELWWWRGGVGDLTRSWASAERCIVLWIRGLLLPTLSVSDLPTPPFIPPPFPHTFLPHLLCRLRCCSRRSLKSWG